MKQYIVFEVKNVGPEVGKALPMIAEVQQAHSQACSSS
jgi:hypothetical protein